MSIGKELCCSKACTEEEEDFYMLEPANKADRIVQHTCNCCHPLYMSEGSKAHSSKACIKAQQFY